MLILHLDLVESVELGLGLGCSCDDLLDLVLLESGVLQKTVRVGGSVAIHVTLVVVTVAVVGWALTL